MGVKRTFVALVVAGALAVVASAALRAQAGAVTYKLGTFEQGGRTFLGLVLRDTQIVDIARANTAFSMIYIVGGLVGRPLAGAAMDTFGDPGLGWTVALFYGFATLMALLAMRRSG